MGIFLPFSQKISIFSKIWYQKWILWLISIPEMYTFIYITVIVWKLQHSICFKKIWVHTPLTDPYLKHITGITKILNSRSSSLCEWTWCHSAFYVGRAGTSALLLLQGKLHTQLQTGNAGVHVDNALWHHVHSRSGIKYTVILLFKSHHAWKNHFKSRQSLF